MGRDRNNKAQNPGEVLQGRSCTQVTKRGDVEEDEEELGMGRALHCNKEKSVQDKDVQAWVGREMQTQRNKGLQSAHMSETTEAS